MFVFRELQPMPTGLRPGFAGPPPAPGSAPELVEPHGLSAPGAAAKLRVTRRGMSNLLGGRAGLPA